MVALISLTALPGDTPYLVGVAFFAAPGSVAPLAAPSPPSPQIVEEPVLLKQGYFVNTNKEYPPRMRTVRSAFTSENIFLGSFANFAFRVFPLSILDGV